MRLLYVHERFGAMGGAEVNAYATAAALKERGHALGIAHGAPTGKAENAWQEVFLDRFPLVNGAGQHDMQRAIAEFEPEAIYVHKLADLLVLSALVESGRPLVRMVHDHDLYCLRSYKYHPVTRTICQRPNSLYCVFPCGATLARNRDGPWPLKWVSFSEKKRELQLNRRFHRMVVATEFMKTELLRNGFDADRIEIHAPVPIANGYPAQSSFGERNLIIYAGQIIRGKGVDVLLHSLALLRIPFECVILGDGSYLPHCQALSRKLNLQDRVTFKGYVPPAEMAQYYSNASVAVISSVWPEPFGAVGLEAMRFGLPVVGFDAGGVKEWLHDGVNGFLVPRLDRAGFAWGIERLLKDKNLARKMGRQGREMAGQRFNFEAYISGLESMFHRVIAESPVQAA